jgi:hypothetical protein
LSLPIGKVLYRTWLTNWSPVPKTVYTSVVSQKPTHVLFTDPTWFLLDGYGNSQNSRFPLLIHEFLLHDVKICVQCAVKVKLDYWCGAEHSGYSNNPHAADMKEKNIQVLVSSVSQTELPREINRRHVCLQAQGNHFQHFLQLRSELNII